MVEIIPTIIAASKEELQANFKRLESLVSRISIDIMDGLFVASRTVGPEEVLEMQTHLAFDLHLMITNPEDYLPNWIKTGADRIIIHVESSQNLESAISLIKGVGKKIGLAVNPETSIFNFKNLLDRVDLVQFMTVHPGRYGAPFVDEVISKISNFHGKYPHIPIAVDGGINPERASEVIKAGASILNVGSYLQNAPDISAAIKELQAVT